MNKQEIKCNRCGLCCKLPSGKDCRYLIRIGTRTTICRVYPNRLGHEIGEGQFCNDILDVPKCFKDCPYNILKDTSNYKLQD